MLGGPWPQEPRWPTDSCLAAHAAYTTRMSIFGRALAARQVSEQGRRFVFVPYDQLSDAIGPLSREPARELGVVVVECPEKAGRRPYHQQKLALVLTNLRHFALEQAARGIAVRHVVAPSYAQALSALSPALGQIRVMRPAERELRVELAPLLETGALVQLEHEGWLTSAADFSAAQAGPPWRMDAFYRYVRRRLNVLMVGGKPLGGRFSFDTENRRPWRGQPEPPRPPTFQVDEITSEVCELVRTKFARHPGALMPAQLPASLEDAEELWARAKAGCLEHFGPFEDAMSTRSRALFHTQISMLLNLQRLSAARVVREVAALSDVPLPSKEGFVRQVLGWREYMRHVHDATDGFRVIRGQAQPRASAPGDGGYGAWRQTPWQEAVLSDGGSKTSVLGAERPVPPAYWGARSGLRCLDEVIATVWEQGYSHHITRLMVLSNIAMLLDVSPRELSDWFWVAYVDAYDWVVEPNVHGMGTFGLGDLMTTKPYVAGSGYIHRMSDYCEGCRFDPKTTCPLPGLYWAYLGRHRNALSQVDRMRLPLLAESRRSETQRQSDRQVFGKVSKCLERGEELTPDQPDLIA